MRPFVAIVTAPAFALCLAAQEPPPLRDHLESTSASAREHQYHASISGKVLGSDGQPLAKAIVLVFGYQPFYWALPLARTLTDEHGDYRCDDISGAGTTAIWVVSPEGTPFAATAASLTLVSGRHSQLRPLTLPEPKTERGPATTFRGRLLAEDGEPIVGALLRLMHDRADFDPSCYAFTDADGAFSIPVRTGTPSRAQLFFGSRRLEIEHEAGVETLRKGTLRHKLDLTGERTLQSASFQWVSPPEPVPAHTELAWSLGGHYRPCLGGRVAVVGEKDYPPFCSVRVSAPGHLARFVELPQEELSFTEDVPRELQVVDTAGKPVKGAIVDLVDPERGIRFQEGMLGSHRTDDIGKLRLLAPKAKDVVVYVYADGYTPGRDRWSGDAPLHIELTRRTARLHLELDDDSSAIYVRRAGTFDLEHMVYPTRGALDLELAPGTYEVTRYREGGPITAKAVTLAADAKVELTLDADDRPTVAIVVPELAGKGDWWAHASRSAIGGMVANRAIWTERDGPMPTRELAAQVEKKGDRRFLLRLPTSGRFTLFVGHESLGHRLFREVVVAFGQHYEIELPTLDGVLEGTVPAMPEQWTGGFAMDGVAGPRLWLEPEGATAFGALVTLPEPAKFQLKRLPRGSFTLHHHLYETGHFRSVEGTWGGLQVTLAETPGAAGELARGPDAGLTVRLLQADGSPVDGRLAIRDRMSESWQQVMRAGSTLIYAADPIPQPPSARLIAGVAVLGKVRRGRVSFELLGDDGSTRFFTRDVEPGTELEVRLDAAK